MTTNFFICFRLTHSLYMVGHELPRRVALHFVPIHLESANALMKDRTLCYLPSLIMAKFLMGFCCSYFCAGGPYSTSGLTAVSQQLKAGDRNPHVMILLKYIFYHINDPVFSPNLATAYSTKTGLFTKRIYCRGKIVLVNRIGFPHTSSSKHFENLFLHGVVPYAKEKLALHL